METIGVRELRQRASAWLARVEAGESVAITSHGRLVAMLTQPPRQQGDVREELARAGRLVEPSRSLSQVLDRGDRQPAPSSTAELLDELRAERF